MKKKVKENQKLLREQILQSMVASFKIEGINVPADQAAAILKKVEATLEK
jgi:hypothetical protein